MKKFLAYTAAFAVTSAPLLWEQLFSLLQCFPWTNETSEPTINMVNAIKWKYPMASPPASNSKQNKNFSSSILTPAYELLETLTWKNPTHSCIVLHTEIMREMKFSENFRVFFENGQVNVNATRKSYSWLISSCAIALKNFPKFKIK